MITQSDIRAYLNNVAEQAARLPKVVARHVIPESEVKFHEISLDQFYSFLSPAERRLSDQIDIICSAIQQATDAPQVIVSAEPLLDEWEDKEAMDIMADVFAAAVGETIADVPVPEGLPTLKDQPLAWVHFQLAGSNPWELYEGFKGQILENPACNLVLMEILKDAKGYADRIPMAQDIADTARDQLNRSENVAGLRPADIYRRFMAPLRWIKANTGLHITSIIRDLDLAQSLPRAELDAPDWVDAYTGEVDPEARQERELHIKAPKEFDEASEAFSEAFNMEDGEDVEIFDDDMRAVDEKAWQAVQHEYHVSQDFNFVLSEAWPLINEARQSVREYMAFFERTAPAWRETAGGAVVPNDPKIYAIIETKKAWDQSDERRRFLEFLQEAALTAEPEDIAVIFMKLQNGLMFRGQLDKDDIQGENDIPDFEYPPEAYDIILKDGMSLGDWLEDYADLALDQLNDYLPKWEEPDQKTLDDYAARTVEDYVKVAVEDAKRDEEAAKKEGRNPNILKSPAFIEGFLRAAFNARTLTSKNANGEFNNSAVEAGWDAWREARSPEGNAAFHKAVKEGKDRKACMAAFWSVINKGQRQKDVIVKLDQKGLTLKSGRHVDWHIATLKVKNDELELSDEDRNRLSLILTAQNWGRELLNCLISLSLDPIDDALSDAELDQIEWEAQN
jgi:hypothetical protein